MTLADKLFVIGACRDARVWLGRRRNPLKAWKECKRGDWMLWLLAELAGPSVDERRRTLVLAACACARLALPYVPAGEVRPLKAIEAAEDWARGGATTLAQVKAAAYAAAYAADAAASRAAYTADDAAAAYDAAYAAAYAAADAAAAAASATYAAADARAGTLSECADIVRSYFPDPPIEALDARVEAAK